jgi:toxin-antitoxin system PIN domain toxin
MAYLLDVSLVIALLDRMHVAHDAANDWFSANASAGWATCPIVENGAVRIMCQPSYPNVQESPALVAAALRRLCQLRGHEFWLDSLSLVSSTEFDLSRLPSARHVTDTYLLGLAVSRQGKLATLDKRLVAMAVRNGASHLEFVA